MLLAGDRAHGDKGQVSQKEFHGAPCGCEQGMPENLLASLQPGEDPLLPGNFYVI